jgi:NADH-quinone oxidoreductase subunit K
VQTNEEDAVIPTSAYLILGGLIFTIGAVGVLTRRSALIILMCVELMLNSVNLTLIALSRQWDSLNGQVFVFMVMAVAAAEVAVGLAIIIAHHRHSNTTNIDQINLLKW